MVGLSRNNLAFALAWTLLGCGLEGELVGPLTDRGHAVLPDARDTIVTGRVDEALSGAAVRFLREGGGDLGGSVTTADAQGAFATRFSGVLDARGGLVAVELGARAALGILPELPAQPTVFHEERWIALGELHPVLGELGLESTVVSLMVFRAASHHGVTLAALKGAAIVDALDEALVAVSTPGSSAAAFAQAVATLDAAAMNSQQADTPFDLETLASGPALRDPWLAAELVDLDGDGWQDSTSEAFDALLDAAASEISLDFCYVEDTMPVVFQVELREGAKDGNCAPAHPYKWAANVPQSRVFFTGGVHTDTPICDDDRQEACLSPESIDPTHQLLGAWEPNVLPMWDDGTHGDDVAGDGIWTIAFELPYWAPGDAPDGAGLRLGYKYTFGLPGQGWTGSEEWPGNQRILEVDDLNGDHLVVRRDVFGDEAANKDKVNALKPSQGGCGTNAWVADAVAGCAFDTRERQVDVDGDCVPDGWPSSSSVAALVEACPGTP